MIKNKIQIVLDEHDRSQPWLAKQIKKATNTVNSWCNQKTQPNLKDLAKISDVFSISIYELIENNHPDRCKIVMIEDLSEK